LAEALRVNDGFGKVVFLALHRSER
jgi:hypothetical protein